MATKLNKPVSREVNVKDVFGRAGDVIATFASNGVTLRGKGRQRKVFISWTDIGKHAILPSNAPSKYLGNTIGWLVEE